MRAESERGLGWVVRAVDLRTDGARAPAEGLARSNRAGSYERSKVFLAEHGVRGLRLVRKFQLRQQHLHTQRWTFLNAHVVLLKQPHVPSHDEIAGWLSGDDAMKAKSADETGLIKADIPDLHGFLRFFRGARAVMAIFEQMHIRGLWPMAALQFEAHSLAHGQQGEIMLPHRRPRKINRLAILRLDETRPVGGT